MGKVTELRQIKISDLKPYERNAKKHPEKQVEQIGKSIQDLGFLSPCLIDQDYNIIAGHGRIMAAKKIGWDSVPCVFIEGLTETERKAYILADNRLTEIGDWDMDLVQQELELLADADFDISITGFDLDLGFDDTDGHNKDDEWTEPAELAEEPKSCFGDIYQLGNHRLMCGDSTDENAIDCLLDGNFMRMTVTSPPYGVGKDYEEAGIEPWKKTIGGVIDAIKDKTLIICWNIGDLFSTGTQFTEPTCAYSIQMMSEAGYGMLYNRIWKKPGGNFASNNPYYTVTTKPVQDYEYLIAFAERNAERHLEGLKKYLFHNAKIACLNNDVISAEGGPKFMFGHWFTDHQWAFIDEKNYNIIVNYCQKNGIKAFERKYEDIKHEYLENTIFSHTLTDNDFSDWGLYGVWEFNTVNERLGGHAAAFPVELPSRYIKMHSYKGSNVLDPFGGTGTTLIACEQLNRKCFMMERDPHYVDVIIDRWEKSTGQQAVLIGHFTEGAPDQQHKTGDIMSEE